MARKKKDEQAVTATVPAKVRPGPRNQAAIAEALAAYQQRPMRVSVKWEEVPGGHTAVSPHTDDVGHTAQMVSAMGTASTAFMLRNFTSLEVAVRARDGNLGDEDVSVNAALALVAAVAPENEVEGALAIQIASNHALTMEMLCRPKTTSNVDHLALYGNMAVKLQRTFTAQLEALARLRGKGQQTVRVEHVTVAPGGQAIVGDVHHYGRGAGTPPEIEDQSHAAGNFGQGSALSSPNQIGDAVPVASRERSEEMQDARGHKPRRAGRKPKRD